MPCAEFEDLLVEFDALEAPERARVEAHLAECAACRAWEAHLATLDRTLTAAFSEFEAPAGLAARVRERTAWIPVLRPPSAMPEVLDFIGWAAILAVAVALWNSPAVAYLLG